ncbi:MAG: O-antigen ligase family protein [Nitrospirae bacterium]|nr:O-antigen ligase family protein [Nitrospirota bacterium]
MLAFLVLFFAANFSPTLPYDIGVKITPANIVIALWLIYALLNKEIRQREIISNRIDSLPLIFACLFLIWNGVGAILSPLPEMGLAQFMRVIRNFILFLLIILSLRNTDELKKINLAIFIVGIFFACIVIGLYFNGLNNSPKNICGSFKTIGVRADGEGVLRASGLIDEPNSLALLLTMSFLCVIWLNNLSKPLKYLGSFIIFIAIMLTFSKTVLASLFISPFIIGFLGLQKDRYSFLKNLKALLIFICLAIPLLLVIDVNFIEAIKQRVALAGMPSHARFQIWYPLYQAIGENPMFGGGLMAAHKILKAYSHNSYLDILIDIGLIGFAFFLLIVISIYILLRRKRNHEFYSLIMPWNYIFIIIIIFFFFFSFDMNRATWFVFAIAAVFTMVAEERPANRNGLSLYDLWRLIIKKRGFIAALFLASLCAAGIISSLSPKIYRGEALVQIMPRQEWNRTMIIISEHLTKQAAKNFLSESYSLVTDVSFTPTDTLDVIRITVDSKEREDIAKVISEIIKNLNNYPFIKSYIDAERNMLVSKSEELTNTLKSLEEIRKDYNAILRDKRKRFQVSDMLKIDKKILELKTEKFSVDEKLKNFKGIGILTPIHVLEKPIKPTIKLNVALAGIVSILIGVFLAVLRESFKGNPPQQDD